MHYYQFNIGDYHSHTSHLSELEDLAYRRLLDYYYLHESPIPNDIDSICRKIRMNGRSTDVQQVLNEFFILVDNSWVNDRADSEIFAYKGKKEQTSNAGKASARARIERTFNGRSKDVQLNINHKPLTNNHETLNINQELRTKNKEQNSSAAEKSAPPKIIVDTEFQNACKQTWKFYSDAYWQRYNTEPVRNAKVNSQIKSFVQRLGYLEAPDVAAHYVKSNAGYYVQRGHATDGLLADAEKLRMEWATGKTMTATRARQIDKTESNRSAVGEAMKILEARNAEAT